ncbi:MAG: pantoate--beta-alanine ligase [Bdellovibrionales bacterium]
MQTLETVQQIRAWRHQVDARVGFVPTMGALHPGHLSLVRRAREECDQVIVSIFVNPTQFNDPSDLQRYPRPLEADLAFLRRAGVHTVFLPKAEEIYSDQFRFEIREKEISRVLCGPRRPGHFEGVLTVVLKLFNLVRPTHAYFGEKDYQQLLLIQQMVDALFLDVNVVGCATLREMDGLAMSSRNLLLTADQRKKAPRLYQILTSAISKEEAARELAAEGFRVDYVEDHWGRRFAAVSLGSVRLIDNVPL